MAEDGSSRELWCCLHLVFESKLSGFIWGIWVSSSEDSLHDGMDVNKLWDKLHSQNLPLVQSLLTQLLYLSKMVSSSGWKWYKLPRLLGRLEVKCVVMCLGQNRWAINRCAMSILVNFLEAFISLLTLFHIKKYLLRKWALTYYLGIGRILNLSVNIRFSKLSVLYKELF